MRTKSLGSSSTRGRAFCPWRMQGPTPTAARWGGQSAREPVATGAGAAGQGLRACTAWQPSVDRLQAGADTCSFANPVCLTRLTTPMPALVPCSRLHCSSLSPLRPHPVSCLSCLCSTRCPGAWNGCCRGAAGCQILCCGATTPAPRGPPYTPPSLPCPVCQGWTASTPSLGGCAAAWM